MNVCTFPYFMPNHSQAYIALFRNVLNALEIKNRIIFAATAEGDTGEKEREAVNFAFIDARLITSKLHLETAIYQAILAGESQAGLRTKTVHSEILFYLNPTNNITEAIRRYGVSSSSTELLVVRIDSPELTQTTVQDKMCNIVRGDLVPLSELKHVTVWTTIKKYHKLNDDPAVKNAEGNPPKEHSLIDNIVTSFVAMKIVMQ